MVFKRATVEDPERVLHLSPDATGVTRGLDTLEGFTELLRQSLSSLTPYNFDNLNFKYPG